jgi:hypothetical protein
MVTVMSLAGEIQGDCSTIAGAFVIIATLLLQIRCFRNIGIANRAAASVSQGTSNLSFAAREEVQPWDILLVFRSCARVGGGRLFGCFWRMFLNQKPPESGCIIRELSHPNAMAHGTGQSKLFEPGTLWSQNPLYIAREKYLDSLDTTGTYSCQV